MPQEILMKDFGAGWIPSDDAVSGRKNGFTNFDNVCLDTNGAVTNIAPFTQRTPSNSYANVTDMDDSVNGLYIATKTNIYRNATVIASGGSTYKTAFGAAFNYELIASGNVRIKDDGANVFFLGISPPMTAPVAIPWEPNYTYTLELNTALNEYGISDPTYHHSPTPVINNAGAGESELWWSWPVGTGVPGQYPADFFTMPNRGDGDANPTDNDVINFTLYPYSSTSGVSSITDITFIISLNPSSAPNVNDPPQFGSSHFTVTRSGLTLFDSPQTFEFKRSDFTYNGPQPGNGNAWQYINGFGVIIKHTAALHVNVGGTVIPVRDAIPVFPSYSTHMAFYGGDTALTGTYTYLQIAVNANSNYLGQSSFILSPQSNLVSVVNQRVKITPTSTVADAQVNQMWLYRIGGNLPQWYRVYVGPDSVTPIIDSLSDESALTLDITLNTNLVSTGTPGISDPIYSIVGPVNGRWFYFTNNFMYPSDLNNPDLVDPTLAVRISGAQESFLFAEKISEGVVIVATTRDFYVLSGTFATLPDNSIDIYYRPLVCSHPAISPDSTFHDNAIYYLSTDGIRVLSVTGQSFLLVYPNLYTLYLGDHNPYGYIVINLQYSSTLRSPIAIQNNKLYFSLIGSNRVDVFDIGRQYWRNINTFFGNIMDITSLSKGRLGHIIGGFGTNTNIIALEDPFATPTFGMPIVLQTPYFPLPAFGRNDYYTVKIKGSCTTSATIILGFDDGTSINLGIFNTFTDELNINIVDPTSTNVLQPGPTKKLGRLIITTTSQMAVGAFIISAIAIVVEPRPMQVTQLILRPENFNSSSAKRLRVWPLVIDTLGSNVEVYGSTASGPGHLATLNTTNKATVSIFFTTDVFQVDYGITLVGPNPFEYYGNVTPNIVQTLPQGTKYDQIGPVELFRYSKIQIVALRIFSFVGGTLPYEVFYDDVSEVTGTVFLISNLENTIEIMMPKGIAGTIPRIVFGPVDFEFFRYYTKVKATLSGRDTTDSTQWLTIPAQGSNM